VALALGVALLGGCANQETGSIAILRALTSDDMCQAVLDETKSQIDGVFDVNGTSEYYFFVDLRNQTLPTKLATQRIFVYRGAHVTLRAADSTLKARFETIPAELRTFDVPGFGSLKAGDTLGTPMTVVPFALRANAAFRDLAGANATMQPNVGFGLLADVEAYGSMDGANISSNKVTYPIQVCSGCLVQDLGPCEQIPSTFKFEGRSCSVGVDLQVQCCDNTVNGHTLLECPGIGTKPATP
jgi:hypothetical protein